MLTRWMRKGTPWGLARGEIEHLQRRLDRLFGRSMEMPPVEYPALNLWSNTEQAVLTAELPGMRQEDIELTVSGSMLTIKGEKKVESEAGEYCRRERASGSFIRTIDLPFQVESDKVNADFKNGILTIKLPRAEADKPRRISVKSQ